MTHTDAALTPIGFDILLALAAAPLHGYAVMQGVEERSGTRLHAGTLYRALARMVDDGLIEELDEPPPGATDERRRYYRITERGRAAAGAEADRLARQVDEARALGLIGGAEAG